MKSNYNSLGNYIGRVEEKNHALSVTTLLGVSMTKTFIPSVANTVGVDMANYQIVRRNQFACKLMSVGRDEQLPVDLLKDYDAVLVSSAYYVFESLDINILLPEYLMMWFCRKETDRWVGYISGGDVRGGISWDTFCEMQIIVPSIETQREIVKEYNTIVNRIKLNKQINQKLEETAQALYKHWFVDFEFPNENGQPYKSSGGKMIYNEELDIEIPEEWEVKNVEKTSDVLFGYSFDSKLFSQNQNEMPVIRIRDILPNRAETFTSQIPEEKYIVLSQDLLIGMDGKFHSSIWLGNNSYLNQRVSRIRAKNDISVYKIYFSIKDQLIHLEDSIFGTTVGHLSNGDVRELKLLQSPFEGKYKISTDSLLNYQINLFSATQKLIEIKEMLLSKISKYESLQTSQAI